MRNFWTLCSPRNSVSSKMFPRISSSPLLPSTVAKEKQRKPRCTRNPTAKFRCRLKSLAANNAPSMELDSKRAPVANNTMNAAEWICPNLTRNGNVRAGKFRFGMWNLATFTTPLYRCIHHCVLMVAVVSSFCFLPDSAGNKPVAFVLSQQKCNWPRGCQLGTSQLRKSKDVKIEDNLLLRSNQDLSSIFRWPFHFLCH